MEASNDRSIEPNRLVDLARDDHLTPQQVQRILRQLDAQRGGADEYTLLNAVGWLGPEHESVVASYLERPDDPMLSRLALQILVHRFGKAEAYMAQIAALAQGVEWDEDEDVRLVALSAAGQAVRERPDGYRVLLLILLDTATDNAERSLIRSTAIEALRRGLGEEWSTIIEHPQKDIASDQILDAGLALLEAAP